MQIGNADLDRVCKDAIVPALENCGLAAKRVDKHNQGGLLKGEIVGFIETADIIVADLTNERPNCYLEVGYAMGLDKLKNLILTARADHQPDRPGRKPEDPKVHFDLAGYDILYWNPADLPAFSTELEKRVKRRRAILAPASSTKKPFEWDEAWFAEHRKTALPGFAKTKLDGSAEFMATLSPSPAPKHQGELLRIARDSQITTFGWPIGLVMDQGPGKPRPTTDGIVAELSDPETYDYWALRRTGDFYLLKSLFEDSRDKGERKIYFNTRIVRITEALLYLMRVYTRMEVDPATVLHVRLRHTGLKDRTIKAVGNRFSSGTRKASVDAVESGTTGSLADIEARLPEHVKALLQPMFVVFDYFELSDKAYADIVNNFVAGKVT